MATGVESERPSPERFFDAMQGFQRTAALKAAIDLDLFTAIGEGSNSVETLVRRCAASERGIRVLCDYLVIQGFLSKSGERYTLTADSAAFLDRRSPAYIGSATGFIASPTVLDAYRDLAAVVRKGGPLEQGTLIPDNPVWVEFARSMAPLMAMLASLMAGLLQADTAPKWKVLDIAAGHGLFGIELARCNRNAQIVAVDWPSVLEVARENAQKAGVADRYRTIPGSAFDVDFGSGYNIALLTNFLHHFDPRTNESFLRKVFDALAPGGRAVTLEFVPNDDRVSPPQAAAFSLTMLAATPGGDAYTFCELQRMFRNAGFRECELKLIPPSFESVVISYK